VGAVVVKKFLAPFFLITCLTITRVSAQDLPADELQINLSGYFDSFDVNVLYPNISLTGKVSETTSITGRYLVDMISAASIRGSSGNANSSDDDDERFDDDFDKILNTKRTNEVDAVTSASIGAGGERESPSYDDVRHQFNLGITKLLAGSRISLNGIYSTERDYTSSTLAGTISRDFALKNTIVEIGFVRSWDRVFPVTKDWKRRKNVVTYSANFSQLLSTYALIQFLTSYTENTGYLADAYNQISIGPSSMEVLYDPIHPDNRIRRAVGTQIKFRLDASSSMQVGYRYYWDSWEVISHTISANYMTHLDPHIIFNIGWRHYLQSRAYFFKPEYMHPEPLMTVDIKLDEGYSNELQLGLTLNGGRGQDYLPFLTSENMQYNISLNIYNRQTETGYWYNGKKSLLAANYNFGLRYRF
jgi:hypothetical protein